MARDHARIHVDIWGDDDWLDLSVEAQMLYFTLYTSSDLSLCGSGTWNPKRLQQVAHGWTIDRIEAAAAELSRGLFLVIDTATDEFLLRSWVKHDGLWRTPNMAVSVANARASLGSRTLRGVVVHEMTKLRKATPESKSWEKETVEKMLSQRAVDPADLDPFDPGPNGGLNGSNNPSSKGGSNPYSHSGSNPTSNGGPTTATTTTTATERTNVLSLNERASDNDGFRRIPIPADWAPNDVHRARYPDLDLDAQADDFRDHAIATGRHCDRHRGWDSAFNRWCTESKRRAAKDAEQQGKTKHKMRVVAERLATEKRIEQHQTPTTTTNPDQRAILG